MIHSLVLSWFVSQKLRGILANGVAAPAKQGYELSQVPEAIRYLENQPCPRQSDHRDLNH
jgi:hypothetical protein